MVLINLNTESLCALTAAGTTVNAQRQRKVDIDFSCNNMYWLSDDFTGVLIVAG